jgi:hypothetical protein
MPGHRLTIKAHLAFQRITHTCTPMDASSTLTPAQVAVVMVEQAVAKHNTRYDKTFFKAVSHQ